MKTQNTNLIQVSNKEESQHFSNSDKINNQQANSLKVSFCSADLWNIQKHRKTGITYRKHL